MTETRRPGVDMFEMWDRGAKLWMEYYNSCARTMGGFAPGFGVPGMQDWAKVFGGFAEVSRVVPPPFQLMKDMNAAAAKGLSSYARVADAWLRGVNRMAAEAAEVNRRVMAGEPADASGFLEAMRTTGEAVCASCVEAMKDTPFEGVKDVDEAVKQLMAAFPEEQGRPREFFEKFLNLNVKAVNTSLSAMKEANKNFAHMLEKGSVTGNGFKAAMDSYGEVIRDSVEMFRLSSVMPSETKEVADDITNWAKASVDLSGSWFEMNLKLFQGMWKSAEDMRAKTDQLMKETRLDSPDQAYRLWSDVSRSAMEAVVGNSQYFNSASRFINSYTEWVKAGNRLYRDMMTPPFVTREDLEQLHDELRKVKSTMDKKASKSRPEEETAVR